MIPLKKKSYMGVMNLWATKGVYSKSEIISIVKNEDELSYDI